MHDLPSTSRSGLQKGPAQEISIMANKRSVTSEPLPSLLFLLEQRLISNMRNSPLASAIPPAFQDTKIANEALL